ncbi:taurine ABC transporter substrate-binding protein [Nocardia carnea]|uniref:taurine ABC transporter substrate-binding protein n=1 Tax=Nocardia carnea TaxID=37328 RepID=UPI0024555349|nr:glycine betaine ABC transporter substrate-binding protein [Nocardia carnea]
MTRILRTVLALALALAAAGCVESGRGDTGTPSGATCPFEPDTGITATARLGYQAIPNADLYVKDRGLLEACLPNATITWSRFASGADVVQAFGAGSVDIATLGSSPATKAVSAPLNLPVRVLWIHDVIGESESLVAKAPITEVAGLRGKRVATPFGSTAHYSLLAALDRAGLTGQVDLVNLQPEAIPGAWTGNQIDAAWVWAPTLPKLIEADGTVIASSADTAAAGSATFDVAAATTAFLDRHSDFAAVWAKVQNYAIGQLRDNPQDAAVSVGAQLGIDPQQAFPQLAGYTYPTAAEQAGPRYLGGEFAGNLRSTARFLLNQGGVEAVGSEQDYRAALYSDAARAAQ